MSEPVYLLPSPSGWLALDADQLQRALARAADIMRMTTAMTNGMTMPMTTPMPATGSPTPDEPMLDAKEAAALLRLPASTLYRQAKAGTLPAVKVGRFYRFRRSDLSLTISERACGRPNARSTGCVAVE